MAFLSEFAGLETLILILSAMGTSMISATTGMGGGILMLGILSFFLPFQALIPVHGLVQLFSNSARTLFLRTSLHRQIFLPFVLTAPIGAGLAVFLLKGLKNPAIPYLLIGGLILYTLFRPARLPEIRIPHWGFSVLGMITGGMGILIGSIGPLLAPFLLGYHLPKETLVSTKSAMQLVVHLLKIPAFFVVGFVYQDYWFLILMLCLAAVLGTKLGVIVLHQVNERIFGWIFQSLLFISAVRLIWKAVSYAI